MPHLQVAGEARFVTGNIMRHVVVMAGTGAIGLMAVFAVDLLNLFYISILGQRPIAAAVGFAGVIGFFQTSVLIGLTIGASAVVSRSIGAGAARAARHLAGSALVLMVLTGLIVGLGTVALLGPILDVLGATGETRSLAETFLRISSPSLPLLAAGMGCSGLLRSIGDARRAMNVTLFAAARHRSGGPDLDLRPASRPARGGDQSGVVPSRAGDAGLDRGGSTAQTGRAPIVPGSDRRLRRHLPRRRPCFAHEPRNTGRRRLRDPQHGCLRSRCGGRPSDDRSHLSGRIRAHLCAERCGRTDPCAECRRWTARPCARDVAR